jgi:DNA-directed RNA polymerase subunit E'/Rpb7
MSGPYITTVLSSIVSLHPKQMDNSVYKHLKENLIKKLEGRCYSRYGYISKIYEILEYSKGRIIPENPMASATFSVKFSCRLCHPMKKRQIICKIQKINKLFINATNGPITVIITMNRINGQIFYQDAKTNKLMAKTGDGKSTEVMSGKFIKVTVESKSFNDMDNIIMAMGELNNMATDQEIKKSFEEEYGDAINIGDTKLVTFEKYIASENEPVENKDKNLDLEQEPKPKPNKEDKGEKEENEEKAVKKSKGKTKSESESE